ncbi:MAG: 6-phosphogluconolactonase [Deltaproteobacteria bacterium]|nr:6-phosphogluconolactonase [Deltaproteobacteria bacterium]
MTTTVDVVGRSDMGEVAGGYLLSAIEASVSRHGRCRLGVAGGSSPSPVFRWLAQHLPGELARQTVVVTLDERHLPADGDGPDGLRPEHNLRSLREHWIDRASTPPQVLSMVRGGSVDEACAEVAQEVEEMGGLDVVLLGLGPDGHVASLFPGHPGLEARGGCIAVSDSPKPPAERITLTMDFLAGADACVLVAAGSAKAGVLGRTMQGDLSVPVAQARPTGSWWWVLDPGAATELSPLLRGMTE